MKFYKITCIVTMLWLDKPLFISENREMSDVICILYQSTEAWLTSWEFDKNLPLYSKTNRKWLCCLCAEVETWHHLYRKTLGYVSCYHWALSRSNVLIHVSITAQTHPIFWLLNENASEVGMTRDGGGKTSLKGNCCHHFEFFFKLSISVSISR